MADAEGEFAGADVPRTTDYIVGPLANALDILLEFEGGQSELRVADMARRVGLTRNKAFRLVKTLESRGFLQRIGEHYRLGARLLALGELAARSIGVLSVAAQPEMETLARETGETVYLLVPDGNEVVCVAVIESEHYVRISPAIGQRRPLHAGAGQKMLFAGMEDQRIEQVLRQAVQPFTPSTITDAAALAGDWRTSVSGGTAEASVRWMPTPAPLRPRSTTTSARWSRRSWWVVRCPGRRSISTASGRRSSSRRPGASRPGSATRRRRPSKPAGRGPRQPATRGTEWRPACRSTWPVRWASPSR